MTKPQTKNKIEDIFEMDSATENLYNWIKAKHPEDMFVFYRFMTAESLRMLIEAFNKKGDLTNIKYLIQRCKSILREGRMKLPTIKELEKIAAGQ